MTRASPFAAVPRSAVAGMVWPAVAAPAAARHLAILFQLEQSQWWPPEVLHHWQMRQAARLLAHAARHVPFYAARLEAAGIDIGRPLTPEAWARIPVLSRAEVQDAGPALHSTRVPRGHGALATVTTSGSTGRPLSAVKTALQQTLWNCLTLRDHMWQRRDLTAKLAVIRGVAPGQAPYPRGVRYRAWGRGTGLIHATGPAVMLSAEVPLARQLDWLQRENPGYLLTNPSNLHELVRHATATGVALPDLRGVGTLGGILRPEVRTAVRATWNVGIADIYSAQETGYLALQCPDHPHYHVQAETILLEILDPDGHPCAPGETGRVVVTPLHAFAMPLIRYDIGDYAEVGAPCPCGRGLPVLRRVIGRVRNMLVLPSGARIAPTFVNDWYEGLPVRQFQIVQHAPDHLEFRIVAARAFTAADEATVRTRIAARLAEPMRITFGYLDAIPRGVGGKFEDFKCEVPPATSGETVDGH